MFSESVETFFIVARILRGEGRTRVATNCSTEPARHPGNFRGRQCTGPGVCWGNAGSPGFLPTLGRRMQFPVQLVQPMNWTERVHVK